MKVSIIVVMAWLTMVAEMANATMVTATVVSGEAYIQSSTPTANYGTPPYLIVPTPLVAGETFRSLLVHWRCSPLAPCSCSASAEASVAGEARVPRHYRGALVLTSTIGNLAGVPWR